MQSCRRSCAGANSTMKHTLPQITATPHKEFLCQPPQDIPKTTFHLQGTARTVPIKSRKKCPEKLEVRQKSNLKSGVPRYPPWACVEAYQPPQGKISGIKGHLLKPGHKSHRTMPHCQAAPSEHFPTDNTGMCVAWRSPSSNREDNIGVSEYSASLVLGSPS